MFVRTRVWLAQVADPHGAERDALTNPGGLIGYSPFVTGTSPATGNVCRRVECSAVRPLRPRTTEAVSRSVAVDHMRVVPFPEAALPVQTLLELEGVLRGGVVRERQNVGLLPTPLLTCVDLDQFQDRNVLDLLPNLFFPVHDRLHGV